MYTNNELQQIFQGGFDQSAWTNILINLFGKGIDKDIRKTPESFDVPNEMGRGYYLGYLQPGTMRIGLFYYEITQGSVAHKRVGLRNLVRTFINPQWGDFEAALVVFADDKNWRLSFVCNLKGNATQPKRFTFVFGDADQYYQTATRRFCDLQTKAITFDTIKEAFSVEALTKQFYNDLFQWYQWAVDEKSGITFPNNTAIEADDREQIDTKIIRLITRLMFVWFIKQKELVPNILFCANDLRQVIKDFDPLSTTNGNYYNAILQNLFFATLNRAIIDDEGNKRGFAKAATKDVKTLYRYSELFQTSETEVVDLFSEIPFLNGGLFECLDKTKTIDGVERAYNYDGFSRNDKTFIDGRYRNRAFIPNVLFFEPTKGLFPILSRYNFTIEENTPNEQQVALDPELLGKVFENMLGAYNPETKETARNQSGSFYTPREIVNYMVDESLIAYLGDTPLVRSLFADDFILDEQRWSDYQFIAGKLKSVKVLDPACGSGAFPMGLLNRIVDVLKKINTDESTYQLKINLIENCIYGIDIQSIATQISKLRFFISLICNCEKDTTKPNFGIPTLPNLETKFVCANSLLGKKKRQQQLSLFEDAEIEATNQELLKIRHDHFRAKSASIKRRLREKDESLRNKLAGLLSTSFTTPEDAKQLAQWNPYDQNSTADFFDAEWMFGVNDGFDIVIGNPPYISTKGISNENKKKYEQEFDFSDDTYNLFTFKGLSLTKKAGTLNYIIPKTFWTTQTKRNMRDLLLGRTINYVFDTANPFDAVMVDTCIVQVANITYDSAHTIRFLDGSQNLLNPISYDNILQSVYCNTQNSVIFKPTKSNLRIYELYGEKVKELYDKWWDKIKTSRDIEKNKVELEAYRASLKPGDIALLGCLTEGGQGLATANNGRYIAVRKSTKWAKNIIESRPKKLSEAKKKYGFNTSDMENYHDEKTFLASLTELQIAELFDSLKGKYGRDIFGQGYIYKIIEDAELANVDSLTQDEKDNGIDSSKNYYVPYDKGDKDGNRWYLETPFAIAWSKENVHFLKTNSGKRGEGMPVVRNPQFYFREGFCWIDVNSTYLKARIKAKGVFDVLSMSLFTMCQLPDWYYVCLVNSEFISLYVDNFINNTSHFQINDARQLPIIIPSSHCLSKFEQISDISMCTKKEYFSSAIVLSIAEEKLNLLQKNLDDLVLKLYQI